MQDSREMLTFSICDRKIPFWGNFGSKIQNCLFKLKFAIYPKSSKQNSKVMFIYYVLDRKYFFVCKISPKIKILSLSWNLVFRLIRICRIQCSCSLFYFWVEIPILGKFGLKFKLVCLKSNLATILNRICTIQWWCSLFPFLTKITLFV